jgi:hypothetical protein
MKKIILLALLCTGFAVTMPLTAQALDSDKIAQYDRDQYRDNQYRNNRNRDRQFSVYYRNRNDRQWTFEGYHNNRRDARQAANRLERRGYRTYVQVSRRINSGMNRG